MGGRFAIFAVTDELKKKDDSTSSGRVLAVRQRETVSCCLRCSYGNRGFV